MRSPRRHPRRRSNDKLPTRWVGATEFSEDPQFGDPVFLVRTLKQHPQILDDLLEATDLEARFGTKRMAGKWALIMLAFTVSGHVDVEPFLKRFRTSPIWREAGFSSAPSDGTVWLRLVELEQVACAFIDAANKLIRKAVQHEPEIAFAVSVDGTGFETNARLEHCCPDPEACAAAGGRPPKFAARATNEMVKETRHSETDGPEEVDESEEPLSDLVAETKAPTPELEDARPPRRKRPYRYFWLGEGTQRHLYRTLDPDAGTRRYRKGRKKTWLGGFLQPAVSLHVDAPVAINVKPANHQEYDHWSELEQKTQAALGQPVQAAIFDRLYAIKSVFEQNTRQGIATVAPWRKWKAGMDRAEADRERWDRHGVPRCEHCGGPGLFEEAGLGFYRDSRTMQPRIRFSCQLRLTASCGGTQSIACEEEWRMLIPLSRRSETYHALADGGKSLEHIFKHWRDRYNVAGNNADTRPRRPGMAWVELRASAALLIEWFQLSLRHGWIGSHRRRNTNPLKMLHGRGRLAKMLRSRRNAGLDLPYGPAAVAAGLAAPSTGGGPSP